MAIVCERLSFSYDRQEVFRNLSLSFEDHRVTAVLGPSGCGKTTLLHLISGLLEPASGNLHGVEGRRISYLFQEPRLLPWKSVRANIELVLEPHYPRERRREIARSFLQLVGLGDFEEYYPSRLSGGMRQRAAIARAFAYPAQIMLMDEPFQALDLRRKLSLIGHFEALWSRDPRSSVFVTHDIQEAILLGDRIVILEMSPAAEPTVLENPVPRGQRSLGREDLLDLERRLYRRLGASELED
ncbi:MAG TPA: ABC transporter ATP-binding protein [Sediminispirochaeta sp.]|nr:ABC transporter ATP-binding protein [Sediminispirochaeta sp.]